MVYMKPDGTIAIYDWKRAKDIKTENSFQSGLEPVEHLPDTNYWHYTLQLNIYATILEKKYGMKVTELALVILHQNNTSFRVMMLNRLEDEVDAIFADRLKKVTAGITPPPPR
jgi:CRISPR/Cas system-associated exonuclease Cas4 (RecB family)